MCLLDENKRNTGEYEGNASFHGEPEVLFDNSILKTQFTSSILTKVSSTSAAH